MSATAPLQFPRLGKQKLAALTGKARSMGMTPQQYLQHLIDEDLALDRKAQSMSFAEIMGPVRPADEQEIDRLVDQARTRHHQTSARKR